MLYSKGYKYQLEKRLAVMTTIKPPKKIKLKCGFVELYPDGMIFLEKGYAWNGANVVLDTKTILEPSAVHDAFYQLTQEKLIPIKFKNKIDEFMYIHCLNKGMWKMRALWVLRGLKSSPINFAHPRYKKEILSA